MEQRALHYSPVRSTREKNIGRTTTSKSGGKSRNIERIYQTYEVVYNGKTHTIKIKTGTLSDCTAPFSVKVQNKDTNLNLLANESKKAHWMGIYTASQVRSDYLQPDIEKNEIISFSAKPNEKIRYFDISGSLILDGSIKQEEKARLIIETHFKKNPLKGMTTDKPDVIQSELHLTRFLSDLEYDVILCPNSSEDDKEAIILNAHKFNMTPRLTLHSVGNAYGGFYTRAQLFSPTGKEMGRPKSWEDIDLEGITTEVSKMSVYSSSEGSTDGEVSSGDEKDSHSKGAEELDPYEYFCSSVVNEKK
jgi:hypothetical protein